MVEKRTYGRRKDDAKALPVSSSTPPQFAEKQQQMFVDAIKAMNDAGIPYAVSGAFALHEHTGIWRNTKDLDLFMLAKDVPRALKMLEGHGYKGEVKDPVWLAKAWRDGYYVDLITGMSNGVLRVDDSWMQRAIPANVVGVETRVLAAEELIASKIFVTRRERFDGADVAHLIYAMRDVLDWQRIFQLIGDHWEMLLWSLIFYRYVYPRHANEVPRSVWHQLLERFERDLMDPKLDAPFRGSLIDENMFAIDVQEWGHENEIERYRQLHRRIRLKGTKKEPAA
ncbi:MAG TPA: nucleotidyltransferase [Terriglobales bacterium]|nr:nucleotidyltransferase [Terriglobales bacterium]